MRTLVVSMLVLLPGACGVSNVANPARSRQAVRASLLECLPAGPSVASAATHALVEELETLATLPATSDFHLLGLRGSWSERLQSEHSIAPEARSEALSDAQLELVRVNEVVQSFDEEVMRSVATFTSAGVSGRLEVEADVYPTTRSDMLHLMTRGHTLTLDQTPDVPVPALIEALMGQLGPEFRAEEGVRYGLQTSYIDESLRCTRCTTRHLAGYCTVHSRRLEGHG